MPTELFPERTLILMADNRDPTHFSLGNAPYYALAAVINYRYAMRHGYSFRYCKFGKFDADEGHDGGARGHAGRTSRRPGGIPFAPSLIYSDESYIRGRMGLAWRSPRFARYIARMGKPYRKILSLRRKARPSPTFDPKLASSCVHRVLGDRAASWSRLPVLDEVMKRDYDRIVYIDTDAFFDSEETTVSDFLDSRESTLAPIKTSTLILVYNFPWLDREATAGFMIWRRSDLAREMVRDWWNWDGGFYHMNHDFEQAALNEHILAESGRDYRQHIAIVPETTFLESPGQYVRHIAQPDSSIRVPRMRHRLGTARVGPSEYRRAVDDIAAHHLMMLDTGTDLINATG